MIKILTFPLFRSGHTYTCTYPCESGHFDVPYTKHTPMHTPPSTHTPRTDTYRPWDDMGMLNSAICGPMTVVLKAHATAYSCTGMLALAENM